MANRNWHNRLLAALRRQGLPRHYVDRLAAELADHATDISLEEPSMEAQVDVDKRLGSPGELALAAKREFQRRTFAGRHPAITFLLGPVVALLVTFVLSFLLIFAFIWLLDACLGGTLGANDGANLPPTSFEVSLMQIINVAIRFLPFVSTSLVFFYLSRRTGRPVWGTVACGIVAVAAICFFSTINPPGVDGEQGTWTMGLAWQRFGLGQILQAVAPILLGACVLVPHLYRQNLVVAE